MVIRDAQAIKLGSTDVNKIYYGTGKVYDTNKTALEGYCIQNGEPTPDNPIEIETMKGRQITYGRNMFSPSLTPIIEAYISGSDGNLKKETSHNNKTVVFKVKPNTTYTVSKVASVRFRMGTNPNEIDSGTLYNKVSDDSATSLDISTGTDTYLYVFYWTNTDTLTEETIRNSIQIREKCIVDLKSKNLFDANGTYYTRNANTTLSINGNEITISNSSSTGAGFAWWNIPVTSGQNYTISYISLAENPTNNNNHLSYKFNENPITTYTSDFTDYTQYTKLNKTNKVSTAEATTGYLTLVLRTTVTATNTITGVQIEKSSVPTTYEPYYDYELAGIKSKNLYNKDYTKINNSYILQDGTIYEHNNWRISDYIPVTQGQNYTYQGLTAVGTNPYSAYYDKDKVFISSFKQATGTNTITIPNGVAYVRFSVNKSGGGDLGTFQIEKGSTATSYVSYYDYTDTIYTREGKWYKGSKIGKYICNNDLTSNGTSVNSINVLTPTLSIQADLPDSQLVIKSMANLLRSSRVDYTGFNGTTSASKIRISVSYSYGVETYQDVYNLLATLIIYYALETPTEEQITAPGLIAQLNALYQAM